MSAGAGGGCDAPEERLRELVAQVDRIAEIPNWLRDGTDVGLAATTVAPRA
jgi:hypothetical protein